MTHLDPRSLAPLLALLALLAPAATAQSGFVERAKEVGLRHTTVSGIDSTDHLEVTDKVSRDWFNVGIAIEDIDGDNDPDVIACGGLGENSVFRNDGGVFTDVTDLAGIEWGEFDRSAAMADYDLDGDIDLFIGDARGSGIGALPGKGRLYRNDGNGVFEDVTVLSGTYGNGRTLHGYWHDLDMDGLPDLYTSEFNLTANCWYRNNGDGTFTELAEEVGIASAGNSHVAGVFDSDGDGWLDIFVANDYLVGAAVEYPQEINPGDRYYHGLPDGTFEDITPLVGLDDNKGVMGLAFGDVDYDGRVDVYKSNMQNNILGINKGAPGSGIKWTNEQEFYQVDNDSVPFPEDPTEEGAAVGWGTNFRNFDFDRWVDLFVVNGHVAATNPHSAAMPKPQPNAMFMGTGPGSSFVFQDRTEDLNLFYFNDERGCAVGDMDGDLDVDILVASTAGPLVYHENRIDRSGGGLIVIEAETGTSMPQGIGTKLRWVDPDGIRHTRYLGIDAPTAGHGERIATFGTGPFATADIEVTFLSGMQKVYSGVPTNTRLVVTEPEMIRLSTRTLPILAFGMGTTEVVVTAFAFDENGVELDGTAAVSIVAPGLTPLTPVTHVASNEFQRVFQTTNSPGPYRVTVSFDGWQPAVRPIVHVHGIPDAAVTNVVATPQAVRAGSADTFEIAVAPRDANGVGMGAGHTLLIDVPGATPVGAVVDHGDGRYARTFTAPAAPGIYSVDVSVNGFPVSAPDVEAGGTADLASSTLEVEVPLPAQAAEPDRIKMIFTPRDAAGRRLGPKANVRMVAQGNNAESLDGFAPDSVDGDAAPKLGGKQLLKLGSIMQQPDQASFLSEFGRKGRRDGSFVFILEKPAGNKGTFPEGKIGIHVDGSLIGRVPFSYKVKL